MARTATRITHWLTFASVTILGALCIICISGFLFAYSRIVRLTDDAHYISLANNQHMLSEKLLWLTEQDSENTEEINALVDRLLSVHSELLQADEISTNTKSLLKSITPSIQTMAELAETHDSPGAGDRLSSANRAFHTGMSRAVASLEQDNSRHVNSIVRALLGTLLASIALIACALILSIGPIRKRLFMSLSKLEKARDHFSEHAGELAGLREKLEVANEELVDRHDSLRFAYDESTSANKYLILASARFEELFHGVPFACFSVDSEGTVYEWNEAASQLFLIPGHQVVQKPIYSSFLGAKNDTTIRGLIADAFAGKNVTNVEISIPRTEDARQLLISVFPVRGIGHNVTAALIACANITKQKDAEYEARRANKRVESTLESIQDAFVALNKDLVYNYANSTAAELMGMSSDKIVGSHITQVAEGWTESGLVALVEISNKTGISRMFDHYLQDRERWFEFRVYPNEDGVSIFYNDVTERKDAETLIREQQEKLEQAMGKISADSVLLEKQRLELESANRHLRELAITDGLTGLLNHRAMQDELTLAISRATRLDETLSCALLDVDHFKRFNDAHGHQSGDEVLKSVAEVLSTSVRDIDVVARYGGEEFCVILPGADNETAFIACERMRTAIEKSDFAGYHVTASFGVATYNECESSMDLVARADQALYAAKASGRNKTCRWEPPSVADSA